MRASFLRGNLKLLFEEIEAKRQPPEITTAFWEATLSIIRTRAILNAALKNNLMNDCFADAVAYLGPEGEKIREGVREALKAIFHDMRQNPDLAKGPVVFLSESLGSKVL